MSAPAMVWSLGSILVDLTLEVPRLPERGGDLLATSTRTAAGGGFNLAAAVSRQGGPCRYGGPHGTGPYGDQVRAALAAEGIEVAGRPRPDRDTGFCLTLVEPDGERTFVTMPGAEAELDRAELDALLPRDGDLVSISGYDLAYPASGATLTAWLESLASGVTVVLDPGPLVREIPADLLGRVLRRTRVLTMNQREARLAAGPAVGAATTGGALLAGLLDGWALTDDVLVVVREGPAGCVATGGPLRGDVVAVPAPQVVAVDTTGAGDTHTGVLLAALARGLAVPDALARANLAAAISVTRAGPATAPTAAELADADLQRP